MLWLSCPTSILLSSGAPAAPPGHVLTQPPSVGPYTGAERSPCTGRREDAGDRETKPRPANFQHRGGGGPATSWLCDSGQVT